MNQKERKKLRDLVVTYGRDERGNPLPASWNDATLFAQCRSLVCNHAPEYEATGEFWHVEMPLSLEPLERLVCVELVSTDIQVLPRMPKSLERLICRHNLLNDLGSILPEALKEIYCMGNRIVQWPKMPESLECLTLFNTLKLFRKTSNIDLNELDPLPPSLKVLILGNVPLTNIPELPTNLQKLQLFHCGITHLPKLPGALIDIDVYEKDLTSVSNEREYFEAPGRHLTSPSIRKILIKKIERKKGGRKSA